MVLGARTRSGRAVAQKCAKESLRKMKTKRRLSELAVRRPLVSLREPFLCCDGPEILFSLLRNK